MKKPSRKQIDNAKAWLREHLPSPGDNVIIAAAMYDIKQDAVIAAARELGVKPIDGQWVLP